MKKLECITVSDYATMHNLIIFKTLRTTITFFSKKYLFYNRNIFFHLEIT